MRQFCHRMSLAGDCSESVPSSAASEDAIDLPEPFVNSEQLRDSVTLLLKGIGEDISREGLKDTPKVSKEDACVFIAARQATLYKEGLMPHLPCCRE